MRLRAAAFGDKFQRDAIVAPALPRRCGAVIEDMAVVAAAADAMVFGARQDQFVIRGGSEHVWNRREKARPASAALIFHLGGKKR